jgi:hypothetical protein
MAPPVRPIKDRIIERVSLNERGCWIWQGPIFKDGYGAIGIRRIGTKRAHRVSYEAFVGPIPEGAWVLHRCDEPRCVNPEHLFTGTPKDNTQDMLSKGRRADLKGERHPNAKFSERFVWGVRKMNKVFGVPIGDLADMYGMDYFAMHQLARGSGWKCIDDAKWVSVVKNEWRA